MFIFFWTNPENHEISWDRVIKDWKVYSSTWTFSDDQKEPWTLGILYTFSKDSYLVPPIHKSTELETECLDSPNSFILVIRHELSPRLYLYSSHPSSTHSIYGNRLVPNLRFSCDICSDRGRRQVEHFCLRHLIRRPTSTKYPKGTCPSDALFSSQLPHSHFRLQCPIAELSDAQSTWTCIWTSSATSPQPPMDERNTFSSGCHHFHFRPFRMPSPVLRFKVSILLSKRKRMRDNRLQKRKVSRKWVCFLRFYRNPLFSESNKDIKSPEVVSIPRHRSSLIIFFIVLLVFVKASLLISIWKITRSSVSKRLISESEVQEESDLPFPSHSLFVVWHPITLIIYFTFILDEEWSGKPIKKSWLFDRKKNRQYIIKKMK